MTLTIHHVVKTYHGKNGSLTVLKDFCLDVSAGQFVAVMGPSGSGKTTLLMLAGGMLRPDSGTVVLNGTDLYAQPSEARARLRAKNIGFVFQQFHLVPYLNVLENVLTAAIGHRATDLVARARQLLDRLGLAERSRHLPGQLSSGERQRTALARALLHRPGLVLADEPTGNLDHENGLVVLEQLTQHVREGGALLLVTHDPRLAERADRVVRL